LIRDEAAGRRVFELAGRLVDLGVDLGNDDLGLVERPRVEVDERVAQVQLRPDPAPKTGRRALDRDRLAGERLIGRREIQSMAFFRTPGTEWLYSGVTKMTPSALAIASAVRVTIGGKPFSWTS
jgi:hypothetical protein